MTRERPWQVITEVHVSEVTGWWMAVDGEGRVQWRGLGSQAVDIVYAIVSFSTFDDKRIRLMPEQYKNAKAILSNYCPSPPNLPVLPKSILDRLDDCGK